MTNEQSNKQPDISAHVEGNVSGDVMVAGGSITIYASPAPPSIQERLSKALNLVSLSNYAPALIHCTDILTDDPDHPEANLLAAIALMDGRGADRLGSSALSRVEQHLLRASTHHTTAATAWVMLGAVKHDHYVVNGLYEGKPGLKEIQHRLEVTDRSVISRELLAHVKMSAKALKLMGVAD